MILVEVFSGYFFFKEFENSAALQLPQSYFIPQFSTTAIHRTRSTMSDLASSTAKSSTQNPSASVSIPDVITPCYSDIRIEE